MFFAPRRWGSSSSPKQEKERRRRRRRRRRRTRTRDTPTRTERRREGVRACVRACCFPSVVGIERRQKKGGKGGRGPYGRSPDIVTMGKFSWVRPEVYPLYASMAVAMGVCTFQCGRLLLTGPDVLYVHSTTRTPRDTRSVATPCPSSVRDGRRSLCAHSVARGCSSSP